jgi:uncharacterized protein YukE
MPNWTPDWSTVAFDHQAAQTYADACRRTGSELTRIRQQRSGLARGAVIGWEGPSRERFDSDMARWDREAESISAQLHSTAEQVEAAAAEARRMQQFRHDQQRLWFAEAAQEQAAQEQAAEQAAEQATEDEARRAGASSLA